jgi:hypothetical protein
MLNDYFYVFFLLIATNSILMKNTDFNFHEIRVDD